MHGDAAAAATPAAEAPSLIVSVLGASTTIAAIGTDCAAPTHTARRDKDGAATATAAAAQRVGATVAPSAAVRASRPIRVDRGAIRHRQPACQAHAHHPTAGASRASMGMVVPFPAAASGGDREAVRTIHGTGRPRVRLAFAAAATVPAAAATAAVPARRTRSAHTLAAAPLASCTHLAFNSR